MKMKWNKGKVTKIIQESDSVKRLCIGSDNGSVPFTPGQFITLDLPISDKKMKRWRSYSITNAPSDDDGLELIVENNNGDGSEYLFNEIEEGSTLKYAEPQGCFKLPDDLSKPLVFICNGVGIAPIRSMIQHLQRSGKDYNKIHLIYGAESQDNILFKNEFCSLCRSDSRFKYSIALSDDKQWLGPRGDVHNVYMKRYCRAPNNQNYFICGWPEMVDKTVENLILKLGVNRENIHYELYA